MRLHKYIYTEKYNQTTLASLIFIFCWRRKNMPLLVSMVFSPALQQNVFLLWWKFNHFKTFQNTKSRAHQNKKDDLSYIINTKSNLSRSVALHQKPRQPKLITYGNMYNV